MNSRDPLSDTLQSWQPSAPPSGDFQTEVWARIHATQQEKTSLSFARWALPLAASVAVFLGIGAALTHSRRQHTEHMAAVYVQSIDPWQMHRDTAPAP